MDSLTLTRPDDWHLHLRDGAAMAAVLPHTARQFARAIVMPNLKPPVTTTALAQSPIATASSPHCRPDSSFEPLMTLYLTDNTPADEIRRAQASGIVHGVKLYPAGATTNSDSGVTDIRKPRAALEAMQALGLPLQVHGEVTRRQGRCLRPRAGVHRRRDGAAAARLPGAQGRVRAHHDARGGALRA